MRTKSRALPPRPPPTDFDEVKRRFIRQNRELAKNNSTQSLRIRCLENEVSRLLAENLEWRERVSRVEGELGAARRAHVVGDAVRKVKEELQAKLAELSGLVSGLDLSLDHVTGEPAEDGIGATRPMLPATEKKVMEGNWRERQSLTEAMRENCMPTIVEDKHYPRRTLGSDEVSAIRLSDHSSNASPDLGPPPIAHFDYDNINIDPVKQHASSPSAAPKPAGDEAILPGLSTVNLETRKRRKDGSSQAKLEIRRHSSILAQSQSPEKKASEAAGSTMLRTGAKRKLADRDIERVSVQPLAGGKGDGFTFSRRATGAVEVTPFPPPATQESAGLQSVVAETVPTDDTAAATPPPAKPVRKVLGDKSVNMSPRKPQQVSQPAGKPGKEANPSNSGSTGNAGKPAPTARPTSASSRSSQGQKTRQRGSGLPMPSPPREQERVEVGVLATIEIPPPSAITDLAGDAVAAADLFSPAPSEEPSGSARAGRAGTPPPTDLSTLSVGTTASDAGARPSRRARAAVNYAEPSLMAKMRRPSKGFVDAISGLQDPRTVMSNAGERKASARTVVIKREPTEDDEGGEQGEWRSLPPASVAAEKVPQQGPGGPQGEGLRSRSADEAEPAERSSEASPSPSRPSSTVPTLLATSNSTSSSSHPNKHKRHSSNPVQSAKSPADGGDDLAARLADLDLYDFKASSSPASSEGGGGKTEAGKRAVKVQRRHSSVPKDVPGSSQQNAQASSTTAADSGAKGSGSVSENGLAGTGRSERAASRRRSMMV